MRILDAIEKVLKEAGFPLSARDITQLILKEKLWATKSKTPCDSVGSTIYRDMKKDTSRFIKVGTGVFALKGMKCQEYANAQQKAKKEAKIDDSGYVYILTNPSFRKDWVKIGMTERPVNTRSKELDNTAVPLPFEIYATLHTKHRRRIEKLLHGMIDALNSGARIRKSREFFNIDPELALRLLTQAAEAFNEEANICEVFKRQKVLHVTTLKGISPKKSVADTNEHWHTQAQLARIIARKGGNEGAFGGIQGLLSGRRRCLETSKWRAPLEAAGLAFDEKGFCKDWKTAKNPL